MKSIKNTVPRHITHTMLYSRGVCVFAHILQRAIQQSILTTQQCSTPVPMAIVYDWMSDPMPSPNNNTTVQAMFVFAYYLRTPLPLQNTPIFFIALILLFQNCLSRLGMNCLCHVDAVDLVKAALSQGNHSLKKY